VLGGAADVPPTLLQKEIGTTMALLHRRVLAFGVLLAASSFLVTQRSATPTPPGPPILDLQIEGGQRGNGSIRLVA
jgi:hypothetical protein